MSRFLYKSGLSPCRIRRLYQAFTLPIEHPEAEYERLLKQVAEAVQAVAARSPDGSFVPGEVRAEMLQRGRPMGMWEVRGALSDLELRGFVEVDPDTARFSLRSAGNAAQAAGA